MRKESFTAALAATAAVSLLGLTGCGTDLGECDRTMLGGSADETMPAPHTAQVLINASCASGRCHSAGAEGGERVGAPAGLDFDVVPSSDTFEEISKVMDGAAVVQDHAEEMWALIDSGEMPPPQPAGSGEMSATDKETVRNWLACGAPVIATPQTAGPGAEAFEEIYTVMSGMDCQGCHGPGSTMGSFLPMAGNVCAAYDSMVGPTASGPMCGTSGARLIVPSQPDSSLLLQKLKGTQPCGGHMPMGAPQPLAATNPDYVQKIEDWIVAGAPEPEVCR